MTPARIEEVQVPPTGDHGVLNEVVAFSDRNEAAMYGPRGVDFCGSQHQRVGLCERQATLTEIAMRWAAVGNAVREPWRYWHFWQRRIYNLQIVRLS